MSYLTEKAVQSVHSGGMTLAQIYASIAQAEALERIADALEARHED